MSSPADIPETGITMKRSKYTALIVNKSHTMAKEISLALGDKISGCSILYAPTVQLARWILLRKEINLIVSSSVLPDGSISSLIPLFEAMPKAPDLVVVGNISKRNSEKLRQSGYAFKAARHAGEIEFPQHSESKDEHLSHTSLEHRISKLGAALRDRLNNPLQEITAMLFVAQAAESISPNTMNALDAIEKAANNIAGVVRGLEDSIKSTVNAG